MKIGITGATGFLGRHLIGELRSRGTGYVVLSRNASRARTQYPDAEAIVEWNPPRKLASHVLEGLDGIVHLAGATVAQRWTPKAKREILESRVLSTRTLVEALSGMPTPPKVLVSASAVGFYGPRDETEITESDARGSGFLAEVCHQWEQEALRVAEGGIRVVTPRIGVIVGRGGGALASMLLPFRLGLGGPVGDGRQWMSWIHIRDAVGLILYAIQTPGIQGPLNTTAPEPVTSREFAKTLGEVLHRPAFLPVPVFALKLLYGEFADILATGQRVLPAKALAAGYAFQFSDLRQALADVV